MNVIALVGLAACTVLMGALVFLHLARTGLSPLADPVSAYGLTGARRGYAAAAIAAAVAGGSGAVLLSAYSGTGACVILLWAFAGARLLVPLFPMDPAGSERTHRGRLHNLLAIAAFATVTAAAFLAAGPLASAGRAAMATGSTATAVVMAIGAVGVIAATAAPGPRRVFGIAERLIYLGFIAWFLVLTIGSPGV